LNATLGSLGAAILDLKFWYIIFQQARSILPQVSLCIAAHCGLAENHGLAAEHCHPANREAARLSGTSTSQTTADENSCATLHRFAGLFA
jgi:hypothetical protein